MSDSKRGGAAARAAMLAALAATAMWCGLNPAAAGEAAGGAQAHGAQARGAQAKAGALGLPGLPPDARIDAETVVFADPRHMPVRLLRGAARPAPAVVAPASVEILTFGKAHGRPVTVVRGPAAGSNLGVRPDPLQRARIETVSFADPRQMPVTIVRGAAARELAVGLFDPAEGGELDRIAFAVDGVESRHGADPGMWRPEPSGPQGPMQVSLKAALDVGGGDRFDLRQNRLLGRAYLAQMFRRYGNWADALASYNWGPGNLDGWIAAGRPADRLPLDVARYVTRVIRDALVAAARW